MNKMQRINALSLTSNVKDWLMVSRQPRILHVFDRACNFINERKDVLSLVTQEIGNGPFNLVVKEDVFFSEHLSSQSPVSITAAQLHLGNFSINVTDAQLWNPHPDWKRLHNQKDRLFGGLKPCLGSRKSAESDSTHTSLQTLLSDLFAALGSADLPTALPITRRLAGLGLGLTPAGDDVILGALLAVWIIHPLEIAADMAKEIANTAAPLTTSLSAAWLKSVGNGEAGILWHEFFSTLIEADKLQIQTAMDKILAVGETSGADALAGFIGTFISHVESETKLCHS